MRVRTQRTALTTVVVGAAALALGLGGSAHAAVAKPADTAAETQDIVGVGSDTLQNGADFVLDGAANGTTGGFNELGNHARVFNFYSTGDANGRAIYDGTCGTPTTGVPQICSSTNAGVPNVMTTATTILREGTNPVVRPNGSGAGILALIQDSGAEAVGSGTAPANYEELPVGSINYARASRLPNSTEIGECPTTAGNKCGGLHVYQFATDQLEIAHQTSAYNGPAGLSIQQLLKIYTCQGGTPTWNSIDPSDPSTDAIHPLIPQSGSGTRNFFLADLQAANGGTAITPGNCVRVVQEHDPDGIYQDPNPADAIEPFSAGKIALINSGYFSNGDANQSTTVGAFAKNQLTLLKGTPDDGNAVYNSVRGLYFVLRQYDLTTNTTPFQPGGTLNWQETLFADDDGTPWIAQSTEASAIEAAGFTPAYKDCGINPASC